MDARLPKEWHVAVWLCTFTVFVAIHWIVDQGYAQQTYQANTQNFVIYAPDQNLAKNAARLAEKYRRELSNNWLGYEIKPWTEKCPVYIQVGPHAGGETSFAFIEGQQRSEPIGWRMQILRRSWKSWCRRTTPTVPAVALPASNAPCTRWHETPVPRWWWTGWRCRSSALH